VTHWSQLVLHQEVAVIGEGRTVLVGDHPYVVKDATRLPGGVTCHQDSQTQSKPSYFRGHQWGVLGILVGSLTQAFCLPLDARLHQGFVHLRQDELTPAPQPTLCLRLLERALQFAQRQACPLILGLEAFFAVGPVFTRAASLWSLALKQPYIHVLPRAKNNYVAYQKPVPPKVRSRGRPRQYGAAVKLKEVFTTHHSQFRTATLPIYGKIETISYLALNLLWKPLKGPVRFIFAVTKRGPIALMTSDLPLDPLTALSLYCARIRIETMFTMLKSLVGAFLYHFWSKRLPRHSRKPPKNTRLHKPPVSALPAVHRPWRACEGFVGLGCITLGLLQVVALKFPDAIWTTCPLFLRTRSRRLPSEKTVKAVLAQELGQDFHSLAPSATLQIIPPPPGRAQPKTDRNPPDDSLSAGAAP